MHDVSLPSLTSIKIVFQPRIEMCPIIQKELLRYFQTQLFRTLYLTPYVR